MRTKRILDGLLILLVALMVSACSMSAPHRTAKDADGAERVAPAEADGDWFGGGVSEDPSPVLMQPMAQSGGDMNVAPGATPAPAPPKPAPTAHDGSTGPVPTNSPLLIYTANYTMAVYETTQSIDNVQALAKEIGGYLVRRDDRSITIRVPAAKYHNALGDISKLGDVLHHEETVEDVTEQFFDMKTRLDNARAMRVRLQELLAAAKDVKDALSVEKELARVTETIEMMEGKLKRLRELINFSTITVTFSARGGESVGNVDLPFPWLGQLGLGPLLQLR